jgi:hypothetical protein
MISILYAGPMGFSPLGCWRSLDKMARKETEFTVMDLEYNKIVFRNWIISYGGKFRRSRDGNYYIDFTRQTDAIIFKLKFGV